MSDLESTIHKLGFKTEYLSGRMFAQVGQHQVPVQSCEMALLVLTGVCDHAGSWDGKGFSKADADFGHSLAASVRKYGRLTERQLEVAQRQKAEGQRAGLIYKYREQLAGFGFNMEALLDQGVRPLTSADQAAKEKREELLTIVCVAIDHYSDKSWRARIGVKQHYFPMKWVTVDLDAGTITAPRWMLEQKGLVSAAD